MDLGLQARSIGQVYGVDELGMGIPFDFRIAILTLNHNEIVSSTLQSNRNVPWRRTNNGNMASGSFLASADDVRHANRLANTITTTRLQVNKRYIISSEHFRSNNTIKMPDSLEIALKNDSDSENIHAYVVSTCNITNHRT